MNIHEYQAKEILKNYGIVSPEFIVISSLEEVSGALKKLNVKQAVLKIQVHAGGRGKAGGVKIAKTEDEIFKFAKELLGKKIVNNQTGQEGVIGSKIIISPLIDYCKEYYIACVVDRKMGCPKLIASPEGGMEIEEVAEKSPEKILTLPIELDGTIPNYRLIALAKFMGWQGGAKINGCALAKEIAKAFIELDASLLEINPLVETKEGKIIALDAKLSIDENALYRHPDIAKLYDETQIPKREAEAKKFDLAYVALNGTIGCMVNGAGLAMATMDIIHHYGAEPANFLDVGGGATEEKVAEGFKIILQDKGVKAIFVNIFGGIMNCKTLAAGIIKATKTVAIKVPLIVRLEGTNVEEGKKMLADSKLNIQIAKDLADGAKLAVSASKGGE